MNSRLKKILLLVLAAALLAGSGQMQKTLNRDREQLDLTRTTPLKSAPPLLAFTTVALGGFRGLISNFLWIRANDLQQAGKYFEMVQLSSWITDLEPHFPQVWLFQAWNMAWNISVNFTDFSDRWHWVERGLELLRDDGLRYNPDDPLLYFQLSWIFQSKMGQNMDDANQYYKEQWANEMMPFFGPNGTNFDELIHPQTPEATARAGRLRDQYKMDPVFAKQVDTEWGPLDWRVPEASAIYWAALGLEKAKEHPNKVKQSDLTALRRSIYQSMLQALYHGRLVINPFDKSYDFYPDLDLVSKINAAYDTMYAEESEAGQKQAVQNAHRNFLRDAVYFLYEDNRLAEAAKWYAYLGRNYPNLPILDSDPTSLPSRLTLDQYAVACVQGDVKDIDQNRTVAAVEGLLGRSYYELAIGQDDRATIAKLLATKIYHNYETKVASFQGQPRVGLPPLADINRTVLNQLLDPKQGLPYAARAVLRTQLRLPTETASTNAPPAAVVSTNAPETVETNAASSMAK
ncbi:MAG TPA: hypothetical protein VJT54_06810 [Verrucomicrobiae bacterium]|nr:hypothetical protein [Verrucomicrobiae bacterium]